MRYGSTETVTPADGSSPIRIFAPGTELGDRYEIRRVLGIGGSGVVYAAHDRELRRDIALKVLRSDRTNENSLKRFRREVGVARDAHSPHLIRIFDIAQSNDALYLTMELVEGESLKAKIERGALPIDEAVGIFRQVLVALDTLHRLGVVHRDVKPGNILVTPDGVVKLADFGLARYFESGETGGTETDAVVGTFEYLSPEQALGKDLDARTDLYAAGIALYEMLTGQVPFRGSSSIGTVIAHLNHRLPSVRRVRPDTPRWLGAILARLVEKDRDLRYVSAAEALQDLDRHRRPALRWRLRPAMAGLALLVVLAGAAWPIVAYYRSRFAQLVQNGAHDVRALDRAGRTLWSRSSLHIGRTVSVFRPEPGGKPLIAIPQPTTPEGRFLIDILLVDPQTGRTVDKARLPSGAPAFVGFSNTYGPCATQAVDLDHDGAQELVVSYCHTPYYPSFSTLYDRGRGRAGQIFAASGHHPFLGAIDIDGDRRDELIFRGVSNRLGYHFAIAAVRVSNTENQYAVATTPDLATEASSPRALMWYALIGDGGYDPSTDAAIDHANRRIDILFADGRRGALGLHGQPLGPDHATVRQRSAARTAAYTALRMAIRQSEAGYADEALKHSAEAIAQSDAAHDLPLQLWTRRVASRVLIRAGRFGEAEERTRDVMARLQSPADACFDTALAYHLQGHLDRALRWYSEGMRLVREPVRGRFSVEFLEGILFIHAERRQWDAAEKALVTYRTVLNTTAVDITHYTDWLEWRRKGRFGQEMRLDQSNLDIFRYLALEQAWAQRSDPAGVLIAKIDHATVSGAYAPLALSLKAEILNARGQRAGALIAARDAFQAVVQSLRSDNAARVHLDVAAERYARMLEQSGENAEARRVRDSVPALLAASGA